MVNSKKNSKSLIALVVMAFLLVASIVLAATGAWFTGNASKSTDDFGFGKIAISIPTLEVSPVRTLDGSGDTITLDTIMPGDQLDISGSIKNLNQKAYVAYKATIVITLADAGATAAAADLGDSFTGWTVTVDGNKYTAVKYGFAEKAKEETVDLNSALDVTFAEEIGDKLELATGTINVTAGAVQHANYTPAGATDDAKAQEVLALAAAEGAVN